MTKSDQLRVRDSRKLNRLAGARRAETLPSPELEGYAPEHVSFAGRAWSMKAEEEYRSASVFSEIVAGLITLPAPLDVLSALSRVVADELFHATLCSDLAQQFRAPAPVASLERVRLRLDMQGTDRVRQALALLLFEGAVGETISAALFHAGRKGTREPCTRAALQMILRDESRHAHVCWRACAELSPSWSPETRAALSEDLRRSFAAFEQGAALPILRRLEAGETVPPLLVELGVLPLEHRIETFYRSIERVVIPRLTGLGFDGAHAWAQRYRG